MLIEQEAMYQFKDTKETEIDDRLWIPSSAMYYDGLLLEKELEGYQTLSVSGREMLSLNIESDNVQVGSIINNQTLPPRELTIKYRLFANNAIDLQRKFKRLMWLLYRENDVQINFNDELETNYFGRFSSAETVPENTNLIVSSFSIYCHDPRKFSKEYVTEGYISTETPFKTVPSVIIAKILGTGTVSVTNGREKISMTGRNVTDNDIVKFDILNGKVFINDEDFTRALDLTSDFKNFTLKKGDEIKSTNGTLEIRYREVSL